MSRNSRIYFGWADPNDPILDTFSSPLFSSIRRAGDPLQGHNNPTNAQPQHTITLTLTSPAPGGGGGGAVMHGGSSVGQPATPSLIVSAIPGLQPSTSIVGVHNQAGMHYTGGATISATPISSNPQQQPKVFYPLFIYCNLISFLDFLFF